MVREALAAAGVPAVLSGTASVFGTPIAARVAHAAGGPASSRGRSGCGPPRSPASSGARSPSCAGPAATPCSTSSGATLRGWAAVLHERGVAALLEAVTTGTGLPGRLLAATDGERLLTDLRHVAQALHAAAVAGHLGPAALVEWLRHRIADAAQDVGGERSRRLESDAAAVQIITIHRSKGLEFPIVYVPFALGPQRPRPGRPAAARRVRRAGARRRRRDRRRAGRSACARHRAEEAGRGPAAALRRAHPGALPGGHLVGAGDDHGHLAAAPAAVRAPGRRAREPGARPAACRPTPPRSPRCAQLAGRRIAVGGGRAGAAGRGRHAPAPPTPRGRAARRGFARAARHARGGARPTARSPPPPGHGGPGVGSEPEEPGTDDEAAVELARPDVRTAGRRRPALAVADGRAAGRGRLRHARARGASRRPTSPRADLLGELTAHCPRAAGAATPRPGVDADALAAALLPVRAAPRSGRWPAACGSPTSPRATGSPSSTSSCRWPAATPRGPPVALGALAPLLRRHLPADDPLARLPGRAAPGLRRAAAARLPHRQHRRGAAAARPAVRGRRLQDQLARADRPGGSRAAHRRALHARRGSPRR